MAPASLCFKCFLGARCVFLFHRRPSSSLPAGSRELPLSERSAPPDPAAVDDGSDSEVYTDDEFEDE